MSNHSLAWRCLGMFVCAASFSMTWQSLCTAAPKGGFFGAFSRSDDDEDKPKPPVPPLGETIRPLISYRPLPTPLAGPSIPPLQRINGELSGDVQSLKTPTMVSVENPSETHDEVIANSERLRDAIAATVERYRQPLKSQYHPPDAVIQAGWAYGNQAQLMVGERGTSAANAIGSLCWNYPCAGKRLLVQNGNEIIPRVGFGYQAKSGELLAVLALSSVNPKTELRLGDHHGSVADLIRWEQRNVREGADQSFVLMGLSHYLDHDTTWTNAAGQPWSLDRLARVELNRRVSVTDVGSLEQLLGLTYYALRGRKDHVPRTGRQQQVERYVASFQAHAMELQKRDGTWGPMYFGYPASFSTNSSLAGSYAIPAKYQDTARATLHCTGNVLLWLSMSLTPDQLREPEIVRGITYVNDVLATRKRPHDIYGADHHDLAMTMRCLAALSIYHRRLEPKTQANDDQELAESQDRESEVAVGETQQADVVKSVIGQTEETTEVALNPATGTSPSRLR